MTTTTNKGYTEPAVGGDVGSWGNELNADLVIIDANLGSNLPVSITSADVTLTGTQAQNLSYTLSGVLTGNRSLIFPAAQGGFFKISNGCTGAFTVTATVSGGTGVVIPQGGTTAVWSDATNMSFDDSLLGRTISNPAITGGTIDNTPIGQSTAAAGSFTTLSAVNPTFYIGLTNRFRNGTMDVYQRAGISPAPTSTTTGAYGIDGWMGVAASGTVSMQQAAGRSLTRFSVRFTATGATTGNGIKQRIESFVAASMTSQVVTFQAQIFNNTGSSFTPTLTVNHPTVVDNYTSVGNDLNAVSLQACANNAWTLVSYAFTASSSSANGMEVLCSFGSMPNGAYVEFAEMDIRVTPGVTVGLISAPPPPELRPIGIELPLCQRYFFGILGSTSVPYGIVSINSSTTARLMYSYTQMRSLPTFSFGAGNSFQVVSGGSFFTASAVSAANVGIACSDILFTISGATSGNAGLVRDLAGASFIFASAEI